MKVTSVLDTSNCKNFEDFRRYASTTIHDMLSAINGQVDLVDNCATSLVGVTFAASGIVYTVRHGLDRVPNGYLIASRSANIQIWDGGTPNTLLNLYVQASGAGNATLLVF